MEDPKLGKRDSLEELDNGESQSESDSKSEGSTSNKNNDK